MKKVLVSTAALFAVSGAVMAGTHNLTNDWSDTANPNGPWALYRSQTSIFPTNQPNWYNNTSMQHAWADANTSQLAHVPAWIKGTINNLIGLDAPYGELYMHGAEVDRTGSEFTSARWTSNQVGVATISGSLWNLRHLGRTMAWQLRKDGTIVSSGLITSADPYTSTAPLNLSAGSGGAAALTQAIVVGTTLELAFVSVPSNLGEFVGMRFQIQTPAPSRITGVAVLGDFSRSLQGEKLTCEVWKNGVLIQKPSVTVGAGGAYALDPTPSGTCTLKFRSRSSLVRTIAGVQLDQTPIVLNVNLVNGDVDRSGEVDAADIDAVIAAFGSLSGANTDVDGSGEVDAADIDIVIANFGQVDN